ncbi:hypothetical protein PRUPE_6G002100 [Prunus persica]|uniref:Uncharacterized protein n=1 Tax=Prunus persica TaxID=3760 RepID=A0A251NI19_PRUPE|nr:hypothetical protein PRUPE_6G002100 [Prunus persica]
MGVIKCAFLAYFITNVTSSQSSFCRRLCKGVCEIVRHSVKLKHKAAVKEKKRVPKKSTLKKSEALSHQELKSWSQGLPVVSNRIPYTQLLILNQEGKLKHVIKPPGVELQKKVEPVVVLLLLGLGGLTEKSDLPLTNL